ncbi:helix-hairpin-helix domain-containing protein [Phytoactinopolyspora halotolerans]|uniref:Helix-hairpin-helix domain-containing protein n=1 Tax=Phytoactinopolyspora halotolerans TaxID=1981512 RepID=A0A6L9SCZ1_9ACTN|nr:helix-hairpin-helix domain-containing protein [Phytoactinopolyspora halotolerans]NEE02947.1 helix-hairpin-helix domain-containing protein [Phytoactinopolyspora halotolerans]
MGRDSTRERDTSVLTAAARGLGQVLWMLIPVISLSFLAFVPATQTYWRARTAGWLAAAASLAAISAVTIGLTAADVDGSALGAPVIVGAVGGVVAAAVGRKIVFGTERPRVDPAVQRVLDERERRQAAREIAEHDPAMALELGIGRPDIPTTYDDGGLVDLNNAPASVIVHGLGWPPAVVETFVAERDARHGYASATEIGALSGIDPVLLERGADRIVVLPFLPSRGGRGVTP